MFKHCPRGHGEFQRWVERCPDCGAALELGSGAEAPAPRAAELPPAHELTCIERGEPRALHEIAQRLQAAGLSCRIDPYPPEAPIRLGGRRGSGVATTFGLYVLPAEAQRAVEVFTEHLKQSLPEWGGREVAAGTELHACPACGESLAEGSRECTACGLVFPETET